ncbi:efflux transporter periplasmic adaptor subunit [Panacagrimonas perspica]|nr:efflux transporter periplasmic adaptor subunit [Panacagrimonas perspica]
MALVSASLLVACKDEDVDARLSVPLVRTAQVGAAPFAERAFTGVVSARVQSDLGFRVPGKIVERLIDTGVSVKKGQPLLRIDRTDYALATAAQGAQRDAARARAEQSAAEEQRYRGLVQEGAVAASTYDQIKATALAAAAQLAAAQAEIDVAKNEANYSVLLADADGVVVETLAEPGQVVAAGQTVVRLAHSGPREAVVNLPETLRPAIGSGAKATLYGDAASSASARLRQLSESADPATRTFEARYVLEGGAAKAPLGTTVRISIPDVHPVAAARVPLSAIHDGGDGPGVWVVTGAEPSVTWRAVKIASLGQETALLSSGLSPGDRFVTLGAHLLHPNDRVRLDAEAVAVAQ